MGEVSGNEDVARFAAQAIANPLRGIVRLQVARRRELRERVARASVGLSSLLCSQFAAMPDDSRLRTARRGLGRQTLDLRQSCRRQRPARVDLGANRHAVMNKVQIQCRRRQRVGGLS